MNCVVHYDNRILVATDMNIVSAYTFPECKKDGTEFRFSASATTIQVNSDWIVAGAEDFVIKVVKKDKSQDAFELKGHEGPIVSVTLGPNNVLASKGGDGKIKIWDLIKQKDIHTISGLDTCKTFDTALSFGGMSFEPTNGKHFAYCFGKKIVVLQMSNWMEAFTLENKSANGDFTVCTFSPNGKLLAVGTSKGELVIFNLMTKAAMSGDVSPLEMNAMTSIAWNPDQKKFRGELAICDSTGQIEFITGAVDETEKNEKKMEVKERKKSTKPPSTMEEEDEGADDIYKECKFLL